MTFLDELQALIDKERIRYFTAKEVLLHRRWGTHENPQKASVPLTNILPSLLIAEAVRKALRKPLLVLSGYRNPAYNELVGGSETSEHVEFKALDLAPASGLKEDLEEMRRLASIIVELTRSMGWNVGLIHYDNFIHIDVGSSKRTNLDMDRR